MSYESWHATWNDMTCDMPSDVSYDIHIRYDPNTTVKSMIQQTISDIPKICGVEKTEFIGQIITAL